MKHASSKIDLSECPTIGAFQMVATPENRASGISQTRSYNRMICYCQGGPPRTGCSRVSQVLHLVNEAIRLADEGLTQDIVALAAITFWGLHWVTAAINASLPGQGHFSATTPYNRLYSSSRLYLLAGCTLSSDPEQGSQ
jgi:hypothetical protein